jgi:ATP-binding cassette subfamily B multidrug efflux pump
MNHKKKSVLHFLITDRVFHRFFILFLSFLAALLGLAAAYFQKDFVDMIVIHQETTFRQLALPLIYAFFAFLLAGFFTQLNLYWGYREALIAQRKLADKIYEHALRLKSENLEKKTVGETVALYATDVPAATILLEQTFPYGASTFFPLLLAPFALSAMVGTSLPLVFVLVIFVAIVNTALAFRQSRFFTLFKQLAAERVSLVNEWLQSIRSLKILNWIHAFEERIIAVRERETQNRVSMVTNGQLMNAITSHATFVFNIAGAFILIQIYKKELTAGEIWALFWVLGLFLNRPLRQLPWFFTFAFDALTSSRRLQNFFDIEPMKDYSIADLSSSPASTLIEIKNLNWGTSANPVLKNLNFSMKAGEKVAILGEVGCGKSAFLLCLLGELKGQYEKFLFKGRALTGPVISEFKKSLNYVPQESFLMNSNLRDNVTFEYETHSSDDGDLLTKLELVDFNPTREGLNSGLETAIGERGVNLSGGQKQRLSLARSINQEKELILIDDSLSQLDTNTERKVLKDLFNGPLKNKSVIICTHRQEALKFADRIFELKGGTLHERSVLS